MALLLLPVLLLALSACTVAPGRGSLWNADQGFAVAETAVAVEPGAVAQDAPPKDAGTEEHAASDRMLIQNATFRVQVANLELAVTSFLSRVEALGGRLSRREGATVTVRVPASAFEACLDELRVLGPVLQQTIQSSDVTAEYQDLRIQIENARRSRDRLLALLEKAEKVEDVLRIEEQLRRLTTEIERMEGHLKRMADQVALSTVTVTFAPPSGRATQRARTQSRFWWINQLGVEHAMRYF